MSMLRSHLLDRNVVSVQMLGLCPFLAVSTHVSHALALGLASAITLIASAFVVSLCRSLTHESLRLPLFMLVVATFTTAVTLFLEAFSWELYVAIALYFQIIITNCMILGRLEQVASKEPIHVASIDALLTACGFLIAILLLAGVRQLIAVVLPIALDPVGAFIIAGLLIAGVNFCRREPSETDRNIRAATRRESEPHY